ALNEAPDRVGLRYARKVFVDAFLRHRRGFDVELPIAPLGRLYGEELNAWLAQHDVEVLLNHGVKSLSLQDGVVASVELRQGASLPADDVIVAVPFARLLALLPAEYIEQTPYFRQLQSLETSPITSVHLWFDRPVMDLPHVVLVDCAGQWVFNRGQPTPGEHYLQVVVSASRQFRGLGNEEVQRRIVEEMRSLFPAAATAALLRGRVITEQ